MDYAALIKSIFDNRLGATRKTMLCKGFGGPVSEEVIAQVEQQLGYRLPESYRTFISLYGEMRGGDGLRGIDPNRPFEPGGNIAQLTRLYHDTYGLPKGFVVVWHDDTAAYCLDYRDASNPDPPIVLWDGVIQEIDESVRRQNFLEFLRHTFGEPAGGKMS